jgi:hypothetical protein
MTFDINKFKNIKPLPGASKSFVYGNKYFVDNLPDEKVMIKYADGDSIIAVGFSNLDDMASFIFSRGNV